MFTILICKLAAFIGRLIGRGSSLPGKIALKLDKDILSKIKMPAVVIAVTGSNGKTSTTDLIKTAAEASGLRVVCNSEGSNQTEGIATALLRGCNLKREVKADVAILESDERFCQYTFKHFAPTHIVITNLFRDQLTRNGTSEFVAGKLAKGLPQSSVLIINADDPLSASLGFNRDNTLWFSVEADSLREPADTRHAYDDGAHCPLCCSRMEYISRLQNHLGNYRCTSCGFGRKTPGHSVTALQGGEFTIDGDIKITPQIANMFFAYNIAAAYTVTVEALGIPALDAARSLDSHKLANDLAERIMDFDIAGHKGLFLLSKHENSMAYNGAIKTILDSDSAEMTVVIIFDLLSRKYIANDISWLWDIDFEPLADSRIKKVVVGGLYADDVAARLSLADIGDDILAVRPDLDAMMDELYSNPVGDVYLLTCFTDIKKFTKRLR